MLQTPCPHLQHAMDAHDGIAPATTGKDSLDWNRNISAAELTYVHPALNMDSIFLCCEYVDYSSEHLSRDQLSEVLEIIDLIIDKDNAVQQWLDILTDPRDPDAGDSKDLSVQSSPQMQQWFEPLAQQIWKTDLDNCALAEPSEDSRFQLTKLVAYLHIPRDKNGNPVTLTEAETDRRYLVSVVLDAFDQNPDEGPVGLLALDKGWQDEDVLGLKTLNYGIPVFMVGRTQKVDRVRYVECSRGQVLQEEQACFHVYFMLKAPEEYRIAQLIVEHQLEDVVWKSKLDILKDYPQELLTRSRALSSKAEDADILAENAKSYAKIIETAVDSASLGEFAVFLSSLWAGKRVTYVSSIARPLDVLCTYRLESSCFDSRTIATITLNLLMKLSLVYQVQFLRGVVVSLCLTRKGTMEAACSYDDEGNALFLELSNQTESIIVDPLGVADQEIIVRKRVSPYNVPHHDTVGKTNAVIVKQLVSTEHAPDIAAVWYGNPLSSVAIVTVGPPDKDLVGLYLDSVAALIGLEDRPSRAGGLPDPWPYNLSKVMRVIVSNPNIRHIIIVTEGHYCLETIARIENRKDLYPEYSFIPDDLIRRFSEQVLGVCKLPKVLPWEKARELRRMIRNSYQENEDKLPEDIHCLVGDNLDATRSTTRGAGTPFDELLNTYVQHFNTQEGHKLTPTELVAGTIDEAYPAVLASIFKYGEVWKQPDPLQRNHKDIVGHRAVIQDTQRDLVAVGFHQADMEKHYLEEWMSESGLHYTRLRHSFGINQVERVIDLAVRILEEDIMRRNLIMNVHHPQLDQRQALGINEIYFGFNLVGENQYAIYATVIGRSIEALFGIPYDLYAACRFQHFVIDSVNNRLSAGRQQISYGRLVFITHNLHLYPDDVSQEIAMRIIEQSLAAL